MNAGAVSRVTPPVGSSGMSGNGPRSSRTKPGPSDDAGKSLDRGRAGPPGGEDLGRRRAAREGRDAATRRPTRRAPRRGGASRGTSRRHRSPAAPHRSTGRFRRRSRGRGRLPTAATASIARSASASGSLSVSSKARTPPSASAAAMSGPAAAETRRPIATTPPVVIPAGIAGRVVVDATDRPPGLLVRSGRGERSGTDGSGA